MGQNKQPVAISAHMLRDRRSNAKHLVGKSAVIMAKTTGGKGSWLSGENRSGEGKMTYERKPDGRIGRRKQKSWKERRTMYAPRGAGRVGPKKSKKTTK